ncbi:MAG: FHA domain-containing protein FhaB [Verrucomicrobia subdivision 3 bacterium]|nr:FHA domain-containing protein FhaB [Limisphaerales bacterium]MCS1416357.1 FHA domain-containing protein FhaB [Limisphaerales bacterium]
MAKLVVLSEGFAGKTCDLKTDKITIGRVDDNSFPIPEGSVSGRHCEVHLKEGKVYVKDLGSTNGTFISDKKVNSQALLPPGKILRLGQVEIRLETGGKEGDEEDIEKTIVLKQGGVKLGELEKPTQTVTFGKDQPFVKKSNKINKFFIVVGIILILVIIGCIILAVMQIKGN